MEPVNLSFLRSVRQTAHDLIHMFLLPSPCTTLDTLTAVSDGDVCHLIVKRMLENPARGLATDSTGDPRLLATRCPLLIYCVNRRRSVSCSSHRAIRRPGHGCC